MKHTSKLLITLFATAAVSASAASGQWLDYKGKKGPGKGKKVVLISGDEEYRSEEAMPMMGKILSLRHGFDCTVLFAMDDATGTIDPDNQTNIKGMHFIKDADLVVLFTRFRELPDDQMKYFVDHLEEGKPVIGLRTSTHAFSYTRNKSVNTLIFTGKAKDGWVVLGSKYWVILG